MKRQHRFAHYTCYSICYFLFSRLPEDKRLEIASSRLQPPIELQIANHEPLSSSMGTSKSTSNRAVANDASDRLKPRDDVYGPYDHSVMQTSMPNQHTQSPAVTGTSVIGVKFKDGVVLATDNLGSSSRDNWSGVD